MFLPEAGAQDAGQNFGIKFSGFVKTDIFYDSRQSSASNGLREGHFYLYPDDVLYDDEMNDLNANPSFHILNIQTRIRGDITGPDAFGAKTSGAIEAEFFGTSESDLNGFRLRHAYVQNGMAEGEPACRTILASDVPRRKIFRERSASTPVLLLFHSAVTLRSGLSTARQDKPYTGGILAARLYLTGPDGNSSKYIRNSGTPGMHLQVKIPAGQI